MYIEEETMLIIASWEALSELNTVKQRPFRRSKFTGLGGVNPYLNRSYVMGAISQSHAQGSAQGI